MSQVRGVVIWNPKEGSNFKKQKILRESSPELLNRNPLNNTQHPRVAFYLNTYSSRTSENRHPHNWSFRDRQVVSTCRCDPRHLTRRPSVRLTKGELEPNQNKRFIVSMEFYFRTFGNEFRYLSLSLSEKTTVMTSFWPFRVDSRIRVEDTTLVDFENLYSLNLLCHSSIIQWIL